MVVALPPHRKKVAGLIPGLSLCGFSLGSSHPPCDRLVSNFRWRISTAIDVINTRG